MNGQIRAGMAAAARKVLVAEGRDVTAGTEPAVLESMQMPVVCDEAGTVARVAVVEDGLVREDAPLVVLR